MSFKQYSVKKFEYSSLLFELPEVLTDTIISWGYDTISSDHVFYDPKDPTFGREYDTHITLIYGIHTGSIKEVLHFFRKEKAFKCILGKIDIFKNERFDVLVINVECDKLHKLHDKIKKNIEVTETYPEYKPHVTICYLKKDSCDKFIGNASFVDQEFILDTVIFSSKNGEKKSIKLGD